MRSATSFEVIGVRGATVSTFTPGGLIATEHRYFDTTTILSQLGLVSEPTRPLAALPTDAPVWYVARDTPEEEQVAAIGKAIIGAFNAKSETKSESKTDSKAESKTESKTESKSESSSTKSESLGKSEGQASKSEPKASKSAKKK